jgi:hypothetical protein
MQREVKITGKLAACRGCGGQPRHINTIGKDLHHLECCPCGVRTPKCATLQQAVEHWEVNETVDTLRKT